MPLSREELIEISVRYFEGCNTNNHDQVMATFAEDCLMWFPAATFAYRGKQSLDVHFKDFLGTFATVNFHDFTHVADPQTQLICTYFTVILIPHEGDKIMMKNCNIFRLNEQGLFEEIVIYNSGALDQGFHAGNETELVGSKS